MTEQDEQQESKQQQLQQMKIQQRQDQGTDFSYRFEVYDARDHLKRVFDNPLNQIKGHRYQYFDFNSNGEIKMPKILINPKHFEANFHKGRKPLRAVLVRTNPDGTLDFIALTSAGAEFYHSQLRQDSIANDTQHGYALIGANGKLLSSSKNFDKETLNHPELSEAQTFISLMNGYVKNRRAVGGLIHKYGWTEEHFKHIVKDVHDKHCSSAPVNIHSFLDKSNSHFFTNPKPYRHTTHKPSMAKETVTIDIKPAADSKHKPSEPRSLYPAQLFGQQGSPHAEANPNQHNQFFSDNSNVAMLMDLVERINTCDQDKMPDYIKDCWQKVEPTLFEIYNSEQDFTQTRHRLLYHHNEIYIWLGFQDIKQTFKSRNDLDNIAFYINHSLRNMIFSNDEKTPEQIKEIQREVRTINEKYLPSLISLYDQLHEFCPSYVEKQVNQEIQSNEDIAKIIEDFSIRLKLAQSIQQAETALAFIKDNKPEKLDEDTLQSLSDYFALLKSNVSGDACDKALVDTVQEQVKKILAEQEKIQSNPPQSSLHKLSLFSLKKHPLTVLSKEIQVAKVVTGKLNPPG